VHHSTGAVVARHSGPGRQLPKALGRHASALGKLKAIGAAAEISDLDLAVMQLDGLLDDRKPNPAPPLGREL
jgi:hypothetical protein